MVSTVALVISPNSWQPGAPVTMIATLIPPSATGRVTFYDGASLLGVSIVSGGQARFTTVLPATGERSLRAHYTGDTNFAPGDSATVNPDAAGSGSTNLSNSGRTAADTPPPPGPYVISTIVGGGLPATAMPAISALIGQPGAVVTDAAGNVYFSSTPLHTVFRVDPAGTLTRVAGTGTAGYSGDNGPATSAQLYEPNGLAMDGAGNLYIADTVNQRIRKVSPGGTITTVAGNGGCCYSGDNGSATSAQLGRVLALTADPSGNLYVGVSPVRIRKVSTSGIITTIAGDGTTGFSGDNGPATEAQFNYPAGLAVDASGNLFVADSSNNRIRRISTDSIVTTVAGTGALGNTGDNGPATEAQLQFPHSVALDPAGHLYIGAYSVRRIASDGTISTVTGTGGTGFDEDSGAATGTVPVDAAGVAVDGSGNLYVAEVFNRRIRRVSAGKIRTIAGGGTGLGGPAPLTMLQAPVGVEKDSAGNLYFSDTACACVYKVSAAGVLSVLAGTGADGYSGDNGPATSAQLYGPAGLAVNGAGDLYVADTVNSRVRKIAAGTITTVAGTGVSGYSGDGTAATGAQLANPKDVSVDSLGRPHIADWANHRIRRMELGQGGIISTVAGDGTWSYGGDRGPATSAQLALPTASTLDALGNLYIADTYNSRVRKVALDGAITTIAGNGSDGEGGDGGAATAAQLHQPVDVAVDSSGNLFIIAGGAIRVVTAGGTISRIAGNGAGTYPGDGIPALDAGLSSPRSLTVDAGGKLYVTDGSLRAIRLLTPAGGPPVLTVSSTHTGRFSPGKTGQYSLTVKNAALAGPSGGTVTVTEIVPGGFTLSTMSGPGWDCSANVCSRNNVLNPGGSYPDITVSVDVAANAPSQLTNQVVLTGGGASSAGTADLTLISSFSCDVNGDQAVNVLDVQIIVNQALGVNPPVDDLTHDGLLNVADVQKIVNAALGMGCPY